MSLESVINLDRVTKSYGDQTALDGFSLQVPPGSVFALLGENGAGKTTAIRTMLGLVRPDEGTATVLGLDSHLHAQDIRHQVGYVSERPSLYEWMTIDELGWFTAGFYPPGFLQKYRDIVKQFKLPSKRKIKQLSKGMRSKVALSLALSHNPNLLILDEPTSGLDTLVRREFLESMVDFASEDRTVFLSSHQINEVERVADIVAIVNAGKLITCEPLDELKDDSVSAMVILKNDSTPFELAAQVISCQRKGRSCQILVRGGPEHANGLLIEHPLVERFEIDRPSLEEIFVGYLRKSMEELEDAQSPTEVPA